MNKSEFISALSDRLLGLPEEELAERLSFYSEMIDDRIEEGLSEEDAVAEIGSAEDVAEQIIADTPLSTFIKQKVKPKKHIRGTQLLLIILGFPLWFPLLISAAAVVFSLYVLIWAIIVSFWSVFVALAASAVGCLLGGIGFTVGGFTLSGLATIGGALLCAGLSVFTFMGCKAATLCTAKLTQKAVFALKKRFAEKEAA